MGFPALMKSDKCFIGTILSSMIINGFFDIQQGPERSKYFVRSQGSMPETPALISKITKQ